MDDLLVKSRTDAVSTPDDISTPDDVSTRRKRLGKRQVLGLGLACLGLWIVVMITQALYRGRSTKALPTGLRADHLVVDKAARRLSLYAHGSLLKSYAVSIAVGPNEPKLRRGDLRTPEGHYVIDYHNQYSAFHRSLHISYPSPTERSAARKAGYDPGGDVMVHGLPNGFGWVGRLHLMFDWTAGCVAVTDADMDELYRAVPDGVAVDIIH